MDITSLPTGTVTFLFTDIEGSTRLWDAQMRESDDFGPSLNRVARLLTAGHGSQVLLSQATAEQIRAPLPADTPLRLLGAHRLRDIAAIERI